MSILHLKNHVSCQTITSLDKKTQTPQFWKTQSPFKQQNSGKEINVVSAFVYSLFTLMYFSESERGLSFPELGGLMDSIKTNIFKKSLDVIDINLKDVKKSTSSRLLSEL